MANNRLYIVDKSTKEYVLLAKGSGCAWNELWDKDVLNDFLQTRFNDNDEESQLIIGHENDMVFLNTWIVDGKLYNY